MSKAKRIALDLAPPLVQRQDAADGSFTLASPVPLNTYVSNLCHHLHHWAEAVPERTFLAERSLDDTWRHLSYGAALTQVRAIAGALLSRGCGVHDPVMILSDNSIANGVLQLSCLYVGVPVVPVSPAYSLQSQDHAKLKQIFGLVQPKLLFAADGALFQKAFAALDLDGVDLVVVRNPPGSREVTLFSDLTGPPANPAVAAAFAEVGPDTIAKILFTSGSTGTPKGVINTQRMLCSNQEAELQVMPFLGTRPPILMDWLPWNHTFGGNHNLGLVLRNGGTLYIDSGKPAPGLIEQTVKNLKEVSPTIYFNVPRGFDMLLPYLEADDALRDRFFDKLDLIFYAAAALPPDLWRRLEDLSMRARGGLVPMMSAWGSTETAPAVTSAHFSDAQAGVIGIPLPGTEVRFIPNGGKLEMRVRGPQVTPGYYKRDDLTAEAFDADGFYIIGDAGKLVAPDDPTKGIFFDGRIAEDFKLLSGTWVYTGSVRIASIDAAAPLIQDAVVTGHDRDEVGLLIFPNLPACAAVAGLGSETPAADFLANEAVCDAIRANLRRYNDAHPASSQRIARALLMEELPLIDANEITDKGYINQRAVLHRRADLVDRLYSDDSSVLLL